jgi:hypothetical protein
MLISEPIMVVADCLLAVVLLVLGIRLLLRGRHAIEASILVFAGGFLALAAAAAVACVAHGFVHRLGGTGLEIVSRLSALAVGLASFSFLAGVILASFKGTWRRLLLGLVAAELIMYSFWMLSQDGYQYVIYEYSAALVAVALIEIWRWIGREARSAPWIVAGVALSLAAAAVQPSGIAVHSNLDHNLVYHLLQLAGLLLLYRGGRLLHDRLA